MTNPPLTRYVLQLDVLERDSDLSDPAAAALLRSEFALAVNASYFGLLSDDDFAIDVRSREIPQALVDVLLGVLGVVLDGFVGAAGGQGGGQHGHRGEEGQA